MTGSKRLCPISRRWPAMWPFRRWRIAGVRQHAARGPDAAGTARCPRRARPTSLPTRRLRRGRAPRPTRTCGAARPDRNPRPRRGWVSPVLGEYSPVGRARRARRDRRDTVPGHSADDDRPGRDGGPASVVAHAGHWLAQLLYVLPVVVVVGWISIRAIIDRRRARAERRHEPAPRA